MKKLNAKKNTNKPEIPGKVKKGYRIYVMAVLALTLTMSMGVTAFAAGDPITVVNNLSDFIFGLIRAVGLILLGWGIVQVGLSFQSHDPSQRSNGFLTLAGGVILLREVFLPGQYLASVLVVAGVLLSQWGGRKGRCEGG